MRRRIVIALAVVLFVAGAVTATVTLLPRLTGAPAETEPAPVAEQRDETEERPVIEDEPVVPVTMAEAPVYTSTTEDGMTLTVPDAFLDRPELAAVREQIDALEDRGSTVCVALLDLETRRGLWYNADELMYPASSIKAAYCTWIYEANGGAGSLSGTVANCLVNSDNDAYHTLLDAYGLSAYASWLGAHGAPRAAEEGGLYFYPDTTANELASLWEEIHRYGTSEEAGASELAGYLAQTNHSPIAAGLRDVCEVWSKPGWYPADGSGLEATNDAGVVFSDTGAYVMVIMTDISSDLDALAPLVTALDAAHDTMCGDEVAYYEAP